MDIFKTYATDETKELEGVEVKLGTGAYVTVARAKNDAFIKLMISEYEKYQDTLEDDEDLDREISARIWAKTILRGWRGLEYQGKPIDYSIKNATKLLKIKDFKLKISKLADDFELFRIKAVEEDIKN